MAQSCRTRVYLLSHWTYSILQLSLSAKTCAVLPVHFLLRPGYGYSLQYQPQTAVQKYMCHKYPFVVRSWPMALQTPIYPPSLPRWHLASVPALSGSLAVVKVT